MSTYIGQRFGDYRLTRFLGKGSFGEVYLAEHVHEHTPAAVKLIQARLRDDSLKEFISEANTLFQLQHPNVVRLLGFGIGKDDTPFLAMAYAPNGTLRQRYPKGARLSLEAVVNYVKPISLALQYAHDKRLIHRDVKPENILLGPTNEVWLSDFGITAIAHSTRSYDTEKPGGTIPYMAPEQLRGKPRPASDQYALGIMAYEWLCGERPFGGTATEIAMQHLIEPPSSLREKVPGISPEVEQVVLTALAKKPEERFGSVQAFATALEQACRIIPPQNAPPPKEVIPPNPPIPPTLPVIVYTQNPSTIINTPAIPVEVPVSPEVPQPIKPGISRRTLLVAGLSLAGVTTVGGLLELHNLLTSTYAGTKIVTFHSSDFVNSVAWSPDGKRIASGARDDTVQVWDATTGGNEYTYSGHSGSVNSVAWSPDGKRIASGAWDKTVQVWDTTTGGNEYTYSGHSDFVNSVAWSPDGKRIASASDDKTVQVWDATTGGNEYTYSGHSGDVNSVAWSPDGKRIASGGLDKTVQVWDATTGGNAYTYSGHSDLVNSVAWSPDGKRIASGGLDKTVQVWDAV